MTGFSFLHAADLHLGAPFRGLARRSDPETAKSLAAAPAAAFRRIAEVARREQAAFLLLAGDIFDSREVSLSTLKAFRRTVESLGEAGIPVFAVAGNHDPLPWSDAFEAPANLRIFPAETAETAAVTGADGEVLATVAGISHGRAAETRDLVPRLTEALRGAPGFRIALLHANIGGNPGFDPYAPAPLAELLDSGAADYWALGHIHVPGVLAREPAAVVYPGSPQGGSVNDSGARFVQVVRVAADRSVELAAEAVDEVRFETVAVDGLDEVRSLPQLQEKLRAAAAAAGSAPRDVLVRVVLKGHTPLNAALRREDPAELHDLCAEALPRRFHLESVRLDTASPVSAARREGLAPEVEAVRGELPAKLKEYFDTLRIPARLGVEFSDAEFDAIAADAAEMLIDRLAGEGAER